MSAIILGMKKGLYLGYVGFVHGVVAGFLLKSVESADRKRPR